MESPRLAQSNAPIAMPGGRLGEAPGPPPLPAPGGHRVTTCCCGLGLKSSPAPRQAMHRTLGFAPEGKKTGAGGPKLDFTSGYPVTAASLWAMRWGSSQALQPRNAPGRGAGREKSRRAGAQLLTGWGYRGTKYTYREPSIRAFQRAYSRGSKRPGGGPKPTSPRATR